MLHCHNIGVMAESWAIVPPDILSKLRSVDCSGSRPPLQLRTFFERHHLGKAAIAIARL